MVDPLDALPRTPPHPCPYLPGRVARERGFVTGSLEPELYHELMDRGFRRSGDMFYAPDCPGCRACVPLRVPVATFEPSRSQRRVLRRNADVAVEHRRPDLSEATWRLFCRYQEHQHGPTNPPESPASLQASLYADVVDTVEILYRLGDRTVAVSIVDVCSRSVSSVYHFFDPDFAERSLGVFSVLHEIEWAKRRGIPHYYLGYWVHGAATMQYKANYRPHELLDRGAWRAP